MNTKLKHSLFLSTFLLLTGCATSFNEKGIDEPKVIVEKQRNVVTSDEYMPQNKLSVEDSIFVSNSSFNKKKKFNTEEIIEQEEFEGVPRVLLNKHINSINFKGKPFGSVLNLLISDIEKLSVIIEPNVDLSLAVTTQIYDMNLYDALKRVAYSVGQYIYYDNEKEALIISPFQTRKYNIPSGIFIEKNIESESISITPDSPLTVLNNGLNTIGSKNKLVLLDKDSGSLMIKEHSFYIKELDDYIVDFVQDRSREFLIEVAIMNFTYNNDDLFAFDVNNFASSLAGLPINIQSFNGVKTPLSASFGISSSLKNESVSMDAILKMVKSQNRDVSVQRPRILTSNHTVGFIKNEGKDKIKIGEDVSISKSINGDVTNKISKWEEYENSIDLSIRVDAHRKKDYLTISLAPVINLATCTPMVGDEEGSCNKNKREIVSNVSIKDGDIIVLGGLKTYKRVDTNSKNPLFGDVPIIGNIFKEEGSTKKLVETVFLVKVKEINEVEESFKGTSLQELEMLRETDNPIDNMRLPE